MTHHTVFDAHHRHHDPMKNHRLVQFAKLDRTARRHPIWDQLSRTDRPDTQPYRPTDLELRIRPGGMCTAVEFKMYMRAEGNRLYQRSRNNFKL